MNYIVLILSIFLGDEGIKQYIEKNKTFDTQEDILDGRITIMKHHNKGAILNFMEDKPEWIARLSCFCVGGAAVFLTGLFSKKKKTGMKIGVSMLIGGGLSNLYDRLNKGYVVDYFTINAGKLKQVIFNLSDIMIFAGSFITIISSLFEEKDK